MRKIHSRILSAVLIAIVFALTTTAWAGTEKVIHTFTGGNDGADPESGVISDPAGNLYGTALLGGANNLGVVFMLTPTARGPWKQTLLYHFSGKADGSNPTSLVRDAAGNLYGVAQNGGVPLRGTPMCQQQGCGTVFELSLTSSAWRFKLLHAFTGVNDGATPTGVTLDASGNLYVTTLDDNFNTGTVFQLKAATGWTGIPIHIFNTAGDGGYPWTGVTVDSAGDLFGTAEVGGSTNNGTVYELTPNFTGQWTENIIYSFVGHNDGYEPIGRVIFDPAGNLFGTTLGGTVNLCGSAFELTPNSGGGWSESVIYSFLGGSDGCTPATGLVLDPAGNLYGTAFNGAAGGVGAVFELSPNSEGGWSESIVYYFTGGADGANPVYGSLILDSAGNLFGTTRYGGLTNTSCPTGCGVVFETEN